MFIYRLKLNPIAMAQIKVQASLENLYKARTALVLSFLITFIFMNPYIKLINIPDLAQKFAVFFSNQSLLSLYGTLIGLLLAAYAVIIALLPLFSGSSLKQPIFSQVNSLFLFTILDGILLMLIDFTNGVLPDNSIPMFLDIEIFFFFALIIGLLFCVLTLSDLFKIVRGRGTRR